MQAGNMKAGSREGWPACSCQEGAKCTLPIVSSTWGQASNVHVLEYLERDPGCYVGSELRPHAVFYLGLRRVQGWERDGKVASRHFDNEDDEDSSGTPKPCQKTLPVQLGTGEMISKMCLSISSISDCH